MAKNNQIHWLMNIYPFNRYPNSAYMVDHEHSHCTLNDINMYDMYFVTIYKTIQYTLYILSFILV